MALDEALAELIRRAKRSDRAAFGALIDRYERTALAVAYAQNAGQFVQAKAKAKGATNEPNPVRRFWRILAVTAGRARRPRQHANALVVP